MTTRETRRGAALMMVVVILALLLVLAVSFTFLMTQQEGTSVASLGGEQTRIITRTGADHAYARLNERSRLNEFQRWWNTPPSEVTHENNPWVDWQGELTVDLLADIEGFGEQEPMFPGLIDGRGKSRFRVEDPKRQVLGMNIQDETGKINLNFATPQLIGNLIGSSWVNGPIPCGSTGGVYEEIRLDDGSFLTTYDQRLGDSQNQGGGYVVISDQLFSYSHRRGNVLYHCVPNPSYLGADGTNAFFAWRKPDREIIPGEYVTTPTAYKIAYYHWLNGPDGATPALFNSMGDVRRIANMDRWFRRDVSKAPDILGARMDGWPEGIDPVMYQWLEENATVMGATERFDGGWHNPHVVTWADMGPEGKSGLDVLHVSYASNVVVDPEIYAPGDTRRTQGYGIGAGSLVRLRRLDSDSRQTILGYVLGGGTGPLQGGGVTFIRLCVRGNHQVSPNETWIIESAERAEVNINAANFDTLVALLHGVGPRGERPIDWPISRADARSVASEILSERTRDYDRSNEFEDTNDLMQFLTDLSKRVPAPINSKQIGVFARTQRYPFAAGTSPTAKVRFDSLDTYMVDAFATRYQPSGGAMARDGFREWVQIGTDRPRTWHWYTLKMMEDEMRVWQGNILSRPRPAGMVNRRSIGMVELPYMHYPDTERRQRQWRERPWDTRETHNMYDLAQNTNRPEKFYDEDSITEINATILPGSPVNADEYGDLGSGMFSFWYRPQWENQFDNHYLFDVAEQEFSNRMSLLWWGDRRGAHNMSGKNSGLTYRIKDRTLEPGFVELRYEMDALTWRDKEWYHLAMNWKGTELGHQSLLIDGDASVTGQDSDPVTPITNHTYQVNGNWVSRTSTLQHDLEDPRWDPRTQFDIQVHPDDIDAFPPSGVILIGDEAIEYNGNDGYALLNCYRGPPRIDFTLNPPESVPGTAIGARGTAASFHPEGSPVTVFGYTSPIRAYQLQEDTSSPISMQPRWPFLPATNATLTTNLGDGTLYRLNNEGSGNNYYRPSELAPNAGLPGAGDTVLGGDPNHLRLADYAGLPEEGVVAIYGLAWKGYYDPGAEGNPSDDEYYPDWGDFNGPRAIPPTQLANENMFPNWQHVLRFEYLAYDGISASGLNIIERYDENFERKPEADYWHFLGEFDPALFNDSASAELLFWSEGSCVLLCNIPVSNVSGYHNRSVVQVGEEWMFYNVKWNTSSPNPDWNNNTLTGADDHRFDTLIYINAGTHIGYIQGWQNQYVNGGQAPTPRPWRGAMNTTKSAHARGSPVVPTFGTTATTGQGDVVTTILDKNRNKELHQIRVQRHISRAAFESLTLLPAGTTWFDPTRPEFICALDTHVRFDYPANTLPVTNDLEVLPTNWRGRGGNLCKFPTGELPVELPTEWSFAGADPRTPDGNSQGAGYDNKGDFDAFEMQAFNRGDFRLVCRRDAGVEDDLPSEGGDLYVNRLPAAPPAVIKIGDELIAYRDVDVEEIEVWNPELGEHVFEYREVYVLKDITRGVLGTVPAAHSGCAVLNNGQIDGGAAIMNMASLRMGVPYEAGSTRENELVMIEGESGFRPEYGFVRIEQQEVDTEIFGYQKAWGETRPDSNDPDGEIPVKILLAGRYNDPNYQQALFRGAFGTRAQFYSDRALFFDQPVRFPDWFPGWHVDEDGDFEPFQFLETDGIPGCNSPEVSHYQGSIALRNSLFQEFRWRIQFAPLADMSRHSNAIGARLVMRFKRRGEKLPDWGDIPTNLPGGLYSFEFDPTLPNCIEDRGKYWEQTQDFSEMRETPLGVQAERVEWRVYFYFKQGAFERDNYKITLNFQGAEATVHQRTRIMRHEEKR